MSRPVGNLNKATIRREMAKRRAAHLLEQVDTMYALDALAVLQEVKRRRHFQLRQPQSWAVNVAADNRKPARSPDLRRKKV
jgi:hypothetical protein